MARHSENRVELIGNVGRLPELRYVPGSGDAVVSFSVATTTTWKDRATGERKESTEWHRCVAFGKYAEDVVAKYVKGGSYIRVIGRLRTRKWQGQDGQDRYTTQIEVDDVGLLDSLSKSNAQEAPTSTSGSGATPPEPPADDIPF